MRIFNAVMVIVGLFITVSFIFGEKSFVVLFLLLWLTVFCSIFYMLILTVTSRITGRRREALIRAYEFRPALKSKLKEKHTNLTEPQIGLVFQALRDYFQICAMSSGRMVSMPSQVVDDAWHDFILFTKDYETFCKSAFGKYLHHTPAEAMASPTQASDGIKRAWRLACIRAKIKPGMAESMPLLFAIDAMLAIPNGFTYQLQCDPASSSSGFCASDIGSSSGCASGCGGGDSGGCGGDSGGGCGGGCGGGGGD